MKIAVMQLGSYGTNCYIVWDEQTKNAAVIDPGDEAMSVLQTLEKEGLQLQMILLTHAHFDHIGAVDTIHNATGCRVYLHKADLTLPLEMTGTAPQSAESWRARSLAPPKWPDKIGTAKRPHSSSTTTAGSLALLWQWGRNGPHRNADGPHKYQGIRADKLRRCPLG